MKPVSNASPALQRRAASLWPVGLTTSPEQARILRLKWMDSVLYLRNRPEGSHWVVDKRVWSGQ